MDWKKFLRQLIGLRTVSADPTQIGEFTHAANLLSNTLASFGFQVRTFPTAEHHPIIVGFRGPETASPSLLFYAHYDVQPAGPIELWTFDPFVLVERDGKLYGRGVADDKGPLTAMLAALEEVGELSRLRITVLFEGGEEVGSPGLEDFLCENQHLFRADAVLALDTGCPDELQPAFTTALRGVISFEIRLRTGTRDLHSGFGGCVPNAIQELVRVCERLHGTDGRVLVPGFYDGVLPASDEEMATVNKGNFAEEMGVWTLRNLFPNLPRQVVHTLLPSLEFNGIMGGYAGPGSKTIIPAAAVAKCTIRTVVGQNPVAIRQSVENFLDQCPVHGRLDVQFFDSASAYGLDLQRATFLFSRLFHALELSVGEVFEKKPRHQREGGSIGVVNTFRKVLGVDSLLLGTVPPDAQIHAPDENWSMESFSRTRQALVRFLRLSNQLS